MTKRTAKKYAAWLVSRVIDMQVLSRDWLSADNAYNENDDESDEMVRKALNALADELARRSGGVGATMDARNREALAAFPKSAKFDPIK